MITIIGLLRESMSHRSVIISMLNFRSWKFIVRIVPHKHFLAGDVSSRHS